MRSGRCTYRTALSRGELVDSAGRHEGLDELTVDRTCDRPAEAVDRRARRQRCRWSGPRRRSTGRRGPIDLARRSSEWSVMRSTSRWRCATGAADTLCGSETHELSEAAGERHAKRSWLTSALIVAFVVVDGLGVGPTSVAGSDHRRHHRRPVHGCHRDRCRPARSLAAITIGASSLGLRPRA